MAQKEETQHALLIPWGQFAQEIGLIAGIEAVKIKQKTVEHTPQTKLLEFLVAILAGTKHLQDVKPGGIPTGPGYRRGESLGAGNLGRLHGHQPHFDTTEQG